MGMGWNETDGPGGKGMSFGIGRRIAIGALLAVLLVGGAGGWAATARLSGAVIGQGSVVVDEELKAIQHRDGGIVREIAVREGDEVEEGQILIRLEDAQTRAERSIIRSQLIENRIKRARLLAERDSLEMIEFPQDLDQSDTGIAVLVLGETRLFDGNRTSRESQKQQLELTIRQIGDEIRGLTAQRDSKEKEIALVSDEHGKMTALFEKGRRPRRFPNWIGRLRGLTARSERSTPNWRGPTPASARSACGSLPSTRRRGPRRRES